MNMPHGKKQLSVCDRDAIREWIRQEPKTISCRDQILSLGALSRTRRSSAGSPAGTIWHDWHDRDDLDDLD